MELANYKACICEGSAENAIMDILLDYNLLIFNREEMIEEEVIRCREARHHTNGVSDIKENIQKNLKKNI